MDALARSSQEDQSGRPSVCRLFEPWAISSSSVGASVALRRRRGVALVTTVALVAMILSLTTIGLLLARSDLLLFRNFRDGTVTSYRAHGAIAWSVAEVAAGYAFDSLLVGPDGIRGTADDGTLPGAGTVSGCSVHALDDDDDPDPSATIDGNHRVRLLAKCSGPRGARRTVEGIVGRSTVPFVPAALYIGGIDLDFYASATLDGRDHTPGDVPGTPSGPEDPVPEAASPAIETPTLLPSGIRTGRGAPIAALPAGKIDAPSLTSRVLMMAPPFLTSLPEGEFGRAFIHVTGDERVDSPAAGAGLLVVEKDLEIDGPVEFSGVVVVGGSLRLSETGALSIRGFLWVRGDSPGPVVRAEGPLSVVYSSAAVADVDGAFHLPRRPLLLAERELF